MSLENKLESFLESISILFENQENCSSLPTSPHFRNSKGTNISTLKTNIRKFPIFFDQFFSFLKNLNIFKDALKV